MPITTRKDYMERSSAAFRREIQTTPRGVHEHYYAQFVTDETKRHVEMFIPVDELAAAMAEGRNLISIPLDRWDRMTWHPLDQAHFATRRTAAGNTSGSFVSMLPLNRQAVSAAGEQLTRAVLVCIAKEAARQLVAGHAAAQSLAEPVAV